ncbi:MAG TPA: caspase family protein [Patescibacteria group bacterium]|nr:caspase family protein [Patescibacteria group bacterium]
MESPNGLFLPERPSRAVLVGTSSYLYLPKEEQLPTVHNNLVDMKLALAEEEYGGFNEEECTVLENASNTQIFDTLVEQARAAEDTLLIYFAGHGRVNLKAGGEYCLVLHETEPDKLLITSLPFLRFMREVYSTASESHRLPAKRVIIIDSCFSARGIPTLAGSASQLAALTCVEGDYTLTSAAKNELALAKGKTHTDFTDVLLRFLNEGEARGPSLIAVGGLKAYLDPRLRQANLPICHQQANESIGGLALVRNRAYEEHYRECPRHGDDEKGDDYAAIARLSAAILQNTDDLASYRERSAIYIRLGRLDEAEGDLSEIIRINPGGIQDYVQSAAICHKLGNHYKAKSDLVKVADLRPDDPKVWLEIADIAHKINECDEAYRFLTLGINQHPESVDLYWRRSLCKGVLLLSLSLKDRRKHVDTINAAIKDCTKTIQLIPDFAEAYYWRGRLQHMRPPQRLMDFIFATDLPGSFSDYQHAQRLDPSTDRPWYGTYPYGIFSIWW